MKLIVFSVHWRSLFHNISHLRHFYVKSEGEEASAVTGLETQTRAQKMKQRRSCQQTVSQTAAVSEPVRGWNIRLMFAVQLELRWLKQQHVCVAVQVTWLAVSEETLCCVRCRVVSKTGVLVKVQIDPVGLYPARPQTSAGWSERTISSLHVLTRLKIAENPHWIQHPAISAPCEAEQCNLPIIRAHPQGSFIKNRKQHLSLAGHNFPMY